MRTDDYSIIGAAVGGLLSPAIFLHRAPMVFLVSGGAGIGLGAGVWVHLFQSLTKGEDIKPEAMVSPRVRESESPRQELRSERERSGAEWG